MEILQKIKLIKHQCDQHKVGCGSCPYLYEEYKCKIKDITYLMARPPYDWDVEEIERIYHA